MIPCEFASRKLVTAVQAPVIVTPKQRSVAKGRRKVIEHSAIESNDGLKDEL